MERRKSPPPDRHTREPRLKAPPGACDSHFHVFGPQKIFPLHPDRKVDIDDSTFEDFLALQATLGLSRGLLVQSGLHFFSYEHLLHLLCRAPDRLRGVAMLHPGVTDTELRILTEAGVVGLRFYPGITLDIDMDLIRRVEGYGWHPHYLIAGEEQALAWRDKMLASPGPFVLEHTGRPAPEKGCDSDGFRLVLECLDTGRCWVKLSPRFSREKVLPFADTLPIIRKLVAHAPERMLWGSDWPHPNYFDPMPNDADLLDLLLDWAPDEAIRNRILVDNPAELFGFPKLPGAAAGSGR